MTPVGLHTHSAPANSPTPDPGIRTVWLLVMLVGLTLLLRIPNLGYSFRGLEYYTLLNSEQPITPTEDRCRPVYYSMLWSLRSLGVESEAGMRLLSLIPSLLCIPLLWYISRRVAGRKFAILACLIFAVSPFQVEFSQEARLYSFFLLIGMGQVAAYLWYRDSGGIPALVTGAAVGIVGLYTHPFHIFMLMGMGALALLDRKQLRFWPFCWSMAVVGAAYVPNIPNLLYLRSLSGDWFWGNWPTQVGLTAAALTVGYNLFDPGSVGTTRVMDLATLLANGPLVLAAVITFGLLLWGAIRWLRETQEPLLQRVLIATLVLPGVITAFLTAVTHRIYLNAQYNTQLLLPVLLVIAAGFYGLRRTRWLWLTAMLYVSIIGLALIRYHVYDETYGRRENWSGASEYLAQHLSAEAPLVLVTSRDPRGTWVWLDHYMPATRPYWVFVPAPTKLGSADRILESIQPSLLATQRIYYLDSAEMSHVHDHDHLVLNALRRIGREEQRLQFNPRLVLYSWTVG